MKSTIDRLLLLPQYELNLQLIELCIDDPFHSRPRNSSKIQDACVQLIEELSATPTKAANEYDVFISYCHKNKQIAQEILSYLQGQRSDLKIFFDYAELKTGELRTLYCLNLVLNSYL